MQNNEKIDEIIGRLLNEANSKNKKIYIVSIIAFWIVFIFTFLWINHRINDLDTHIQLIYIFIPFAVIPIFLIIVSIFKNNKFDILFNRVYLD